MLNFHTMKKERKGLDAGLHELATEDTKGQFGLVSGYIELPDMTTKIRISLSTKHATLEQSEGHFVLILDKAADARMLADVLRTVTDRVQQLIILSRRDMLKDNAYFDEDGVQLSE